MILMMRHHIGEGRFLRLSFQHKAPADLSWHEKTFQCPIEFNADKTIAYMPLEFLDHKLGGRLNKLQPIVKAYLNRKINKNPLFETSIAHTIECLFEKIWQIACYLNPILASLIWRTYWIMPQQKLLILPAKDGLAPRRGNIEKM